MNGPREQRLQRYGGLPPPKPAVAFVCLLAAASLFSGCFDDIEQAPIASLGGSGGSPAVFAPAAPNGVAASPSDVTVTLTWNGVSGASSYNLYWGVAPGVTKSASNRVAGVSSPYSHTGVSNGTPYYYVITALNAGGESAASAEIGATPNVQAAGAPTGIAASPGNQQVNINWNPVAGATGYNLYWLNSPGVSKTTGNQIAGVSSPYLHSGLTNGVPHYYVVTAANAGGESAASVEVNATPQAGTGASFAYVTNFNSNTVSVIATASNTVTANVTVGNGPLGVAITPDGNFAYVTNFNSANVSVIATASNTVVDTVAVGGGTREVAITPDGNFAYVVSQSMENVSVIDTASNTVTANVTVSSVPQGVAITPDGNFAYVTNSASGTVSVIDTASNTVTATVTVGTLPLRVAVTPDGNFAYVTNGDSNTVSVIATASNTVTAIVTVGTKPRDIAITPDGNFAYVTNFSSNSVSVIATASNAVTATVTVGTKLTCPRLLYHFVC